jgi:CDP-diglyceride synthetase
MKPVIKRFITALLLVLFLYVSFIFSPLFFCTVFALATGYLLWFEWLPLCKKSSLNWLWVITPLYPLAPCMMIIYAWHDDLLRSKLLLLIALNASFDTGAYIVGKLFGKHVIVPTISPKKTWQGCFGGFVFVCFGLFFYTQFTGNTFTIKIILFALAISILAFAGDLFESYLKRSAGIKDIGAILPGHGGLLDRLDSLFYTVWLVIIF